MSTRRILGLCLMILLFWQQGYASSDKRFKHNIQLQVSDVLGVPIENTQFWVTIDVVKSGKQVTLHLPEINFQVVGCSSLDPICPNLPPNGYVYTSAGFLPKDCRPSSLVPISIVAASNNGLTETFSFTGEPYTPPSGYIVQVTNAGAIQIQAVGSFANLLTTGPQNVLPCSISFVAEPKDKICKNFPLSEGEINVEGFSGDQVHGTPAGDNIRDSHINDAFDGVVAWAWTDNHNVDKTANILNTFVRLGKVDKKGNLKLEEPIQLTNFPPNMIAWDTSVAINRKDKNNIVVSYLTINYNETTSFGPVTQNCRAVSFDGGKTWGGVYDGVTTLTDNGPINFQPPGGQGSGDYPGVAADKFGNFWLATTDKSDGSGNFVNVPYLLISTNKGATWNFVVSLPPVLNPQPPTPDGGTNGDQYDYPHICFGSNGTHYGIWLYADYIVDSNILGDIYPTVSFLPINGLGNSGTFSFTYLNALPNSITIPSIAAADDGKFWALGVGANTATLIAPLATLFKSPGAIDSNYAGPWLFGFMNQLQSIGIMQYASVPFLGYFLSVQGLVFDNNRQALYGLFAARYPDYSQNMRLYFAISRNNGQTWSSPFDISKKIFANRGFCSMALDSKRGDLYIGWYDGRKDPTLKSIKYFGASIKSSLLDKLVKKIPRSDPFYLIPAQGSTTPEG